MVPSQASPPGCCYYWFVWLCCLLVSLPLISALGGLSFPFCCISLPAEFMIPRPQERSGVGGPVLTLPCHQCRAQAAARWPGEVWLPSHCLETSASLGVWDCLCWALFILAGLPCGKQGLENCPLKTVKSKTTLNSVSGFPPGANQAYKPRALLSLCTGMSWSLWSFAFAAGVALSLIFSWPFKP